MAKHQSCPACERWRNLTDPTKWGYHQPYGARCVRTRWFARAEATRKLMAERGWSGRTEDERIAYVLRLAGIGEPCFVEVMQGTRWTSYLRGWMAPEATIAALRQVLYERRKHPKYNFYRLHPRRPVTVKYARTLAAMVAENGPAWQRKCVEVALRAADDGEEVA